MQQLLGGIQEKVSGYLSVNNAKNKLANMAKSINHPTFNIENFKMWMLSIYCVLAGIVSLERESLIDVTNSYR